MKGRKLRAWCARCRYDGRDPFTVGTFVICAKLGIEDARREAERLAIDMFRRILPVEVPPPETIIPIPGIIIFVPEEEEES